MDAVLEICSRLTPFKSFQYGSYFSLLYEDAGSFVCRPLLLKLDVSSSFLCTSMFSIVLNSSKNWEKGCKFCCSETRFFLQIAYEVYSVIPVVRLKNFSKGSF